jgi:hypothetical protein
MSRDQGRLWVCGAQFRLLGAPSDKENEMKPRSLVHGGAAGRSDLVPRWRRQLADRSGLSLGPGPGELAPEPEKPPEPPRPSRPGEAVPPRPGVFPEEPIAPPPGPPQPPFPPSPPPPGPEPTEPPVWDLSDALMILTRPQARPRIQAIPELIRASNDECPLV